MRRCKGVLLAGMLMLSMSVPVYADKSAVVKVEAPADTTDYYMTVDSGGVGVDIYPSTDGKGEKLNDKTVRDGTVLQDVYKRQGKDSVIFWNSVLCNGCKTILFEKQILL